MNIDDTRFIRFLQTKKYSDTYIQSILSFARNELIGISNTEILECRDYSVMVEKILHTRYHHKNSRCKMARITISRVADYLRLEAAV